MERETGHILLCRSLAYSDIEVELLNYDEELLAKVDRGQGPSTAGITAHRAADPRHPRHRDRARPADEVLGGAICRHHRHDRRRGDDYALVLHGKYAERNQKAPLHHQEIPRRTLLRPSSTTAASTSAPRSTLADPTAPASGAKTETEPLILVGGRLRHVADLVDPARPHRQRRAAAGLLLLRRADPGATCSISTGSPSWPRRTRSVTFIPVLSHAARRRRLGRASAASSTSVVGAQAARSSARRRGRRLCLRAAADDRRAARRCCS